jgi:hypothetical protein
VRPDLTQPTHWFEEEETIRIILFLRLKAFYLRRKDRLLIEESSTVATKRYCENK